MFSLERLHTYCVLSDQSLHRDADLDGKFEGRSRACIDLRFLAEAAVKELAQKKLRIRLTASAWSAENDTGKS